MSKETEMSDREITVGDVVKGVSTSDGQARRLFKSGGVRVDGKRTRDMSTKLSLGSEVKIGKRTFSVGD